MIRKGKKKDTNDIVALLMCLFKQEKEFVVNQRLHKKGVKKILKNKQNGIIFVVEKNKKIVGCVNILFTISTALGGKVALLEDMIIDKRFRNQGLGAELLEYINNYLLRKKIQRITLLSDDDNLIAHKLYENIGFVRSSMTPYRKIL